VKALLNVLCLLVFLPAVVHASDTYLWEGFEHELNWSKNDDSAATGRVLDSSIASEGSHSLKILYKTVAASGRAAVSRWEDMDWSPYGKFLFDVYYPGDLPDFRPVLVLYTTSRWVQYEVKLPPLTHGWNHLEVDLRSKNFLSSDTSFRREGYLVGRGEMKGVSFAFEPGQADEGAVYVDNLRLKKSGVLVLGDFTLNTTLEGVASTGDLGYVPPGMRLRSSDFLTIESFEDSSVPIPWSASQPGVSFSYTWDYASQGRQALSMDFPEAPSGFDVSLDEVQAKQLLAGSRQFRMDIYNPGADNSNTVPVVALTLVDQQWNYYSSFRNLSHGWNTPIWDFTNARTWDGPALDPAILSNLRYVILTVYSSFKGRLIFDGLATSSITMRAAAKGSANFKLSYNPSPDLELVADTRVDDTFYGSEWDNARDGGAQVSLSAANARLDLGGFRTRASLNHLITAFDHPITQLLGTNALGSRISALESSGRLGEVEVQGVAASRLEYQRYNSDIPTGLGPENVLGLRARVPLGDSSRLGTTFLNHQAVYGRGVEGLPVARQTLGLDYDSHWNFQKLDNFSFGLAAESAVTVGDEYHDQPLLYVPANDRWYYGIAASPAWGRFSLNYTYTLLGYDVDTDFTSYGAETAQVVKLETNLEGLGPLARLRDLPLYDGSVGNNLHLELESDYWAARSRYVDADGQLKPLFFFEGYNLTLTNDFKSKPNFTVRAGTRWWDGQWYPGSSRNASLDLKVPLLTGVTATLGGGYVEAVTLQKGDPSSGYYASVLSGFTEQQNASGGLEWYWRAYSGQVSGIWAGTIKSWQGDWFPWEQHWKWTANVQRSVGSDSVLRFDYGQPVLNGVDFGLQDTLNVYTLTYKTYF
jgi:hypothetical protein